MNTLKIATLTIAAALTLSACSSGESIPDLTDVAENQTTTATSETMEEPMMEPVAVPADVVLPEGSTATGVIVAAVLLTSGDIQEALSLGQVTPSEVEYAELAIKEKTLPQWQELAEAKNQ